jgi:hypothetical protein
LIQEQIAHRIKTPVLPVVHSLHDVNDQLSRGRPFFFDIARDGIVLYQEPGYPSAQPKPLSEAEKHADAQRYRSVVPQGSEAVAPRSTLA